MAYEKAYLLNHDIGQDWDDAGALNLAIQLGLSPVMVVTSTGDTKKRASLVFNLIFSAGCTQVCSPGKLMGGEFQNMVSFVNKNGKRCLWRILHAEPTNCSSFELKYGNDLEYYESEPWSIVKTQGFFPFKYGKRNYTWDILIAAPPCGFKIMDIPNIRINSVVFVGENPIGKKDKGINGGASCSETHQNEIVSQLNDLSRFVDIVYLPPTLTRGIYATTNDLSSMCDITAGSLLETVVKFLTGGKRPIHLPGAIQERIAKTNNDSIKKLVYDVFPNITISPTAEDREDANEYAEYFDTIKTKTLLIEYTASIYAHSNFINSFSPDGTSVEALNIFLQNINGETSLLPKYDMTGLVTLLKLDDSIREKIKDFEPTKDSDLFKILKSLQ